MCLGERLEFRQEKELLGSTLSVGVHGFGLSLPQRLAKPREERLDGSRGVALFELVTHRSPLPLCGYAQGNTRLP